jgi:predicted AlkP superfamily phosphohydrolase/phosphomutase
VARVLLIGLDGFGHDFASRVFGAGVMPFLAGRAAAGFFGPAASTVPPVSTAAWTTVTTGVGIGKHGVVDFRRRDLANYGFARPGRFVNNGDVRVPRIYDLAGKAGLRCFVLNVPVTFPASKINGVLVSGVLTPPASDRGCWPPEFRAHLAGYAYDLDEPAPEDLPSLCGRLEELAAARANVAVAAFGRERFDLGLVVFTGPDRLFHRHYADVYAGASLPAAAESYLHALDAACERLYEAFGADAALIACSDHGFGPGPAKAFFVNRLLRKNGLLRPASSLGPYALNVILAGARRLFGGGKPLPVDWRRTACYGFPLYMRWGGVAANVAGEQPQGKVPAAELPALLRDVADLLATAAGNREAAAEWVKLRDEVYRGPATAKLPHIIFQAPPDVVVSEGKGPGPLLEPYRNELKVGEHTLGAMVLAAGPGISAGGRAVSIEDVAPTAAKLLGLDAGEMDGRPLF